MHIPNIYRKLKQILDDSNVELVNKGWNKVNNLSEIPQEISRHGTINRLHYLFTKEITELNEEDFGNSSIIDDNMFYNFTNLVSVKIPGSVVSISKEAFYYCTSLRNVTLGNGVKTIGLSAFERCPIDNITIPNSVTYIDSLAFSIASSGNVYLYSPIPPTIKSKNVFGEFLHPTIHVPIGSGDAYKSATNWSYHASRIVEDIVIEDTIE